MSGAEYCICYIGEDGVCNTCKYPVKKLKDYLHEGIHLKLCDICYSTLGGEIFHRNLSNNHIASIICYGINRILDEIRSLK